MIQKEKTNFIIILCFIDTDSLTQRITINTNNIFENFIGGGNYCTKIF